MKKGGQGTYSAHLIEGEVTTESVTTSSSAASAVAVVVRRILGGSGVVVRGVRGLDAVDAVRGLDALGGLDGGGGLGSEVGSLLDGGASSGFGLARGGSVDVMLAWVSDRVGRGGCSTGQGEDGEDG